MRSRFYLLIVLFGAAALLWSVYLFGIQIMDPFNFAHLRRVRYTPRKEILIPRRGGIYDAKGNLLVSSVSYYQLDIDRAAVNTWAKRKEISQKEAFQMIATVIGDNSNISKDTVLKRLNLGSKNSSIQISNRISEAELDQLIQGFKEQKLPGLIHNFASMRRIYSKGSLAARLMGAVNEASNGYDPMTDSKSLYKLSGICGIEATYDKVLSGEYGWREIVLDANGNRVPYPDLHEKKPRNGNNLYLTIDTNIQEIVENVLYEGVEKYGAAHGGAVVMDPKTGRVLALAGVSNQDKSDDPNMVRAKSNIPASFMFEPGSTLKPISMLPALEYKLVKPNERIECGRYQVGRRVITDTHNYGALTPREIISKSSNVGVAKLAERTGKTRLYEEYISMGFGQRSALNLFGESSGIFAKLENWDGYSLHSLAFGQAISVTAIQLAAAYSAIANGGKMMKPMIVDSFRDDNGEIIDSFEPSVLRQVSSKAACDTMLSYIQDVVDDGTATHIKMDYISVGGKTGTAEKNVEGTRGYSGGKYNAVFAGMFPMEDPQMVVVVFYDEPSHYYRFGSMSAAPSFKKIVENVLFMPDCQILPYNERLLQTSLKMPDLINMSIQDAEWSLNRFGFLYKIEGPDSASVVIDQFPKAGISVDKNHPITLKLGKSKDKRGEESLAATIMPNLVGMTLRKAVKTASDQGVPVKIIGSGVVRKQSLLPGSRITGSGVCTLEASI
ncbi:MAG: penicillin-binding transpeptidase domain-containing protein [Candidatus Cloacimonetes bacterium]|jgi:cell division protein FtsI/penicillin-binding protein 2|nr:penicillin-binding transpeptidase domain-containing protein [Candidatus Cloacimonadota bacterium]MDD2506055.1 penicillin-binding transpeptidase domain-containing protein [Candidatus Cloacimonadota bacterium]MDD4559555.1 penicillin-binding transpeptidase domain-containing protein [Candidatus Cloacimonadota bacterium]